MKYMYKLYKSNLSLKTSFGVVPFLGGFKYHSWAVVRALTVLPSSLVLVVPQHEHNLNNDDTPCLISRTTQRTPPDCRHRHSGKDHGICPI